MREGDTSHVEIDLDGSSDVARLKEDRHFIQQAAYGRVKELILGFLKDAENYDPTKEKGAFRTRVHNTITVSGSRGSGKTTFITNFFERQGIEKLEVLGVIDPTLIENKENILVSIIHFIQKNANNITTTQGRLLAFRKTGRIFSRLYASWLADCAYWTASALIKYLEMTGAIPSMFLKMDSKMRETVQILNTILNYTFARPWSSSTRKHFCWDSMTSTPNSCAAGQSWRRSAST